MSNTFKALAVGILFLAGVSLCALAVDVSGTWEMTMETPRGEERVSEMKIEQEGDKITVTMEGFQGNEMTGKGTVTDNEVEWTVNMETQRGEFTITYSGTVDGDTMTGQAEMGDFGAMEFTAKKK
ncbi:MAG: hypothetical protein WBB73_10020 [Candidatus Aminicenantaceae bacterium]